LEGIVEGSGVRVHGSAFRVYGSEFRVEGRNSDLRVSILGREREFIIDNLLVRIHLIIEMILVDRPWEFEFPFPGSHISTFLLIPTFLFWGKPWV